MELFGRSFKYPFFAGPVGAVNLHYSDVYTDMTYNDVLVRACAESGIAAFTGDVYKRQGHSRNIYQQMLDSSRDVAVLRGEYPWDGTQFLLSQENICFICSEENKEDVYKRQVHNRR